MVPPPVPVTFARHIRAGGAGTDGQIWFWHQQAHDRGSFCFPFAAAAVSLRFDLQFLPVPWPEGFADCRLLQKGRSPPLLRRIRISPIARYLTFSLKSYLGCVAAVLISFELDLERPAWAMLTAYIVAQPYAGMVQSKALYRVLGTIAGGAFSVFVLGTLSSAPELVMVALALWLGVAVYWTQLDRTAPSSYAFMLAGYTAVIISFPNVDNPAIIFETAIARCEEIVVGIVCATVANQLIFPQSAGAALDRRLELWLADLRLWSKDVLTRFGVAGAADRLRHDRDRLIGDALAVHALREHALFDTPSLRDAQSSITELQHRMHRLLALLVSIEDRLSLLNFARPDVLTLHRGRLEQVARMLSAEFTGNESHVDALVGDLEAAVPPPDALVADRHALVLGTLLARLAGLLRHWQAAREDLGRIRAGAPGPSRNRVPVRHSDPLAAALGAFGAFISILTTNAFWIWTDWPSGAGAVIQAGVICALFAGADDPAALALRFLAGTLIGMAFAIFYILVVLPAIDGLPLLILALGLFYLPIGFLMAEPRQAASALPVLLGFTALLDLRNGSAAALDVALDSGIAQLFGIACAVLILRELRAVGFDWTGQRIANAIRRDLASVAAERLSGQVFESRMFDRINLLQARHQPGRDGADGEDIHRSALAALRIGLNLIEIADPPGLSPRALVRLRQARAALVRMLRSQADPAHFEAALSALDAALFAAGSEATAPSAARTVMALGGIRLLLEQHAGFFGAAAGSPSGSTAQALHA
jgi:uncharacterized membrane protein YccC